MVQTFKLNFICSILRFIY